MSQNCKAFLGFSNFFRQFQRVIYGWLEPYCKSLWSDLSHLKCPEACSPPKTNGYGSIPIDTFLVGWTSIYQLFWGSLGARVLTHPQMKRRDVPQALFRQNLASYWTAATNIWTIRMLLGSAPGHPESGPLCMLSLNGFHSQMMSDGQISGNQMAWKSPQDWYVLDHGFEDDPEQGFVLIYYRGQSLVRCWMMPWPSRHVQRFCGVQGGSTRQQTSPKWQPTNWAMVTVCQCLSIKLPHIATKSLSIRCYSPLSPFLDLGWPQFPWDPAQERRLGRLRGWHLVHALQDHQSGGAGASSRGHGQGESALWQVLEGRWDDGTPGIMGGVDGGDVYGQQIIP